MSRVVLIADSSTGRLIDVAGNNREGGRYAKFAKRILSTDTNPVLDYGGNGGDTLKVSRNGGQGERIRLDAKTVEITGDGFTVGGKTIPEIASGQSSAELDRIKGTASQISVSKVYDQEHPENPPDIQIALDSSVTGTLAMHSQLISGIMAAGYVAKSELAAAIRGITFTDEDELEDVKSKLRVLMNNLAEIAGESSPAATEEA